MDKIKIRCYENDGVYVRGSAFFHNKYLEDYAIANYIKKLSCVDDIIKFVTILNGHFSIIVDCDDYTVAFQDRYNTYHICYSYSNGELYISDDVKFIANSTNQKKINYNGYADLIYTGYINFNDTFVENISKIMAGDYLFYSKKNKIVENKKYYFVSYKEKDIYNDEDIPSKFEDVFVRVAERMVKRLHGRQAVIMLSGGVDSRFCAALLKHMNYENTILVTYGRKLSEEYKPAIKTAKALGFKHYFIPYKRSEWRKTYKDEDSLKYIDYASNMMINAHLREHFVIKELLEKNIIDKEAIIIPGHLGNIAGRTFYSRKRLNSDLINVYYGSKMMFYNQKNFDEKHMMYLKNRLKHNADKIKSAKGEYNICQLYEQLTLQSYTVFYLINSVRAYDYYGLHWYMPLLDNELVDFFFHVSIEDKYKKKLLYELVNAKVGDIPYSHTSTNFFIKVGKNLLDMRYACIDLYKIPFLKCEPNAHLPSIKRMYRYIRNFSSYCAVVETERFKKQLNK